MLNDIAGPLELDLAGEQGWQPRSVDVNIEL